MSERTLGNLLLVSGIVGLLVLAFLFDLVVLGLQTVYEQGGGIELLLIFAYPVFTLLLALGGMGLFRHLVRSGMQSRAMRLVCLLLGLLILFGAPLIYFLPAAEWMAPLIEFLHPATFVFQVGALLAAMALLAWRKDRAAAAVIPDNPADAPE